MSNRARLANATVAFSWTKRPETDQPVSTSVDTGNRSLNFFLNKGLLPSVNTLAFTENIALAALLENR